MSHPAFGGDSRRTLPMSVANMTFMLDRLHKDCSPLQFLRELTQNAIEAIQALPEPKGEIVWDYEPNQYEANGIYKLSVIDTGVGMTGEEMVRYINQLSASMHAQTLHGNFGVGAKIAAVPLNPEGLVYCSWKDGQGYMIQVWLDPVAGVYGLKRWERPDGSSEFWTAITDPLKPKQIAEHGTMIVLLGKSERDDTMQPPPGTSVPTYWIARYLNDRYFEFSKDIAVKARVNWTLPRGEGSAGPHSALITVTGGDRWLEQYSAASGSVRLEGAQAHWWILREGPIEHQRHTSAGHVGALFQNELYDVQIGRNSVSRLQSFGVIFGHQRVVIYVAPKVDDVSRLVANTGRTSLLLDGESLPWAEWAAEFRAKMPDEIRQLVEQIGAASIGHDHRSAIHERLKTIADLFRISRYRPMPGGPERISEDSARFGGLAERKENSTTRSAGNGRSGTPGGREGNIYSLYQSAIGVNGKAITTGPTEPELCWISVKDGTRVAPDLEDRAARYLSEKNLLLLNADFRVFTDMAERWRKRYMNAPGAAAISEEVVREWFEQQLMEVIMGALSLRRSPQWTTPDIEKLWSEEALTAAVLPRYHVDLVIKRTLGAKFGSLKEA